MKSLAEFENFFNQTLFREMESLDARRKKVLNRTGRVVAFSVMATLVFLIALTQIAAPGSDMVSYGLFAGPVLALFGGILVWSLWAHDKTFALDFKRQLIGPIIHFISPELTYQPGSHIDIDTFKRSRLFLTGIDRFIGDDYVFGQIDKTRFGFSEVKAEYKTHGSKGEVSWHTIFKGLFFVADFNKHFEGSTVVLPNNFGRGAIGQLLHKANIGRREKLVKLEDPEFNKYFVVYADDQVVSRYILSPSLMKRLTDFRKKQNNPLYISFVSSFLFLGISYGKNLLEPAWFKSLTRFETVQPYFEDISLAVSIVEDLNLNTRIWTKE